MKAAINFISGDVLRYMEQNNLEFTDSQAAALIYHSWLSVAERHKKLEEFAAETEDENLRKQIMESVSLEREDLRAFHEITEGFVFVLLREYSGESCGYFAAPDLAYAHGLKQECAFSIEKYKIVEPGDTGTNKVKGYWNPYLSEEIMNTEELVAEQDGDGSVARLDFTGDGILKYFWSAEVKRSDKDNMERIFSPDRFENAFVPMPNPFERGDIVRQLPGGRHGVVSTSAEQWQDFLEKVNAGKCKGSDFSDASIVVEFVYDEGYICHDHVNPAFLERYEPGKGENDYDLLMTASELLRGRGGLDWFVRNYEAYKEKMSDKKADGK